ncbi:putative RNA methyltransferase [Agromyces terreus]
MSLDTTWFRCPICMRRLAPIQRLVIGCDTGHRFDVSKHGTVTLLPPKAPRTIGDDSEMLAARASLLDSRLYEPIAHAVVQATGQWRRSEVHTARDPSARPRIADFGSGTGYYTNAVAREHVGSPVLAADRSPIAARMSARAVADATGVILDIWRPLPLNDDVVDIALNVFAPRNPAEYARVMRADGILVVVVPREDHLIELQRAGAMLSISDDKGAKVTAALVEAGFTRETGAAVEYRREIDAAQRELLTDMGPTAHHVRSADERPSGSPARSSVTVSVEVLTFRLDARGD